MKSAISSMMRLIAFSLIFPVYASAVEVEPPQENVVDKVHENVSNRIINLGTRLDNILGVQRLDSKTNKSKIRIVTVSRIYENEKPSHEFNFKAQLSLPNTEKRFSIIVENMYDKNDENSPNELRNPSSGAGAPKSINESATTQKSTDYSMAAALRYVTRFTGFKASFDAGARFTSRIQIFYRFHMEKNFPFGEKWVFRPSEQINWIHDEGHTSSTDLDFDRGINKNWHFRFVNNIAWNDDDKELRFTDGPSWYQTLNKRMGMSYNFRVASSNKPDFEIDNYIVSVSFNQLLYKTWFFWTVTPAISYPRELDFQRSPSITIRFETVFGTL